MQFDRLINSQRETQSHLNDAQRNRKSEKRNDRFAPIEEDVHADGFAECAKNSPYKNQMQSTTANNRRSQPRDSSTAGLDRRKK